MTSFVNCHPGLVLRVSVSLIVVAFSLAGFVGEAGAQSNRPPPDDEFYLEPPPPYPGGSPRYFGAPLPPPDFDYYIPQPYISMANGTTTARSPAASQR